jgi:hypothetical protein
VGISLPRVRRRTKILGLESAHLRHPFDVVFSDLCNLSGSQWSFRIEAVFPDICCFLNRLSTRAANQNQQVIALTQSSGPTLPQLILITHNGSGQAFIALHLSHQAIYMAAPRRFRLRRDNLFILSVAEGQVVRAFFYLPRKPYLFTNRQYPRIFWFRIELPPRAPRRLRSRRLLPSGDSRWHHRSVIEERTLE